MGRGKGARPGSVLRPPAADCKTAGQRDMKVKQDSCTTLALPAASRTPPRIPKEMTDWFDAGRITMMQIIEERSVSCDRA